MARTRVRVLEELDLPGPNATYGSQLVHSLDPDIEVHYFRWRTAMLGRYDVLHIHWPDHLMRGAGPVGTALRRMAFLLLMARSRLLRVAVVHTSHNVTAHEAPDAVESWLVRRYLRGVTAQVRINPFTPVLDVPISREILHGHYVSAFEHLPTVAQVPGRVLTFGLLRRYKGIDSLIGVFRRTPGDDLSLRVVGRPAEAHWVPFMAEQQRADPRISSRLVYVSDDELSRELSAAQVVVLPHRAMFNSGTLLSALSVGRHVVATWSEVNDGIRAEVGERWMTLYRGELTPEVLRAGVAAAAALDPGERPVFRPERDWAVLGAAHSQLYRDVADYARRRPTVGTPSFEGEADAEPRASGQTRAQESDIGRSRAVRRVGTVH